MLVKGSPGVIRFIGTTEFAPGNWVGVELASPDGKNDGSVQGVRYFECPARHGVFVRESMVVVSTAPSQSPEATRPSLMASDCSSTKDIALVYLVVEKLQVKLKRTTDELKACQTKVTELQTKVDSNESIRQEHNDFLKNMELLKKEYEEMKCDRELLHEELELTKQLEEEIKANLVSKPWSQDDAVSILARNKQLELVVANLEALVVNNDHQSLSVTSSHNQFDLSIQLEKAHVTISELQDQLAAYSNLERLVEDLTTKNEDLLNQITTLNELNELWETEHEEQAKSESRLLEEIERLQDDIKKSQQSMQELERKNKFLESRVIKLKGEVDANSTREHDTTINELTVIHDQAYEELNLELRKAQMNYLVEKFRSRIISVQLEAARSRTSVGEFQVFKVMELRKTVEVILDASFAKFTIELPHVVHSFRILAAYLIQVEKVVEFGDVESLELSLESLKCHLDRVTTAIIEMNPQLIDTLFVLQCIQMLVNHLVNSSEFAGRFLFHFFIDLIILEVQMYRDIIGPFRSHVLACANKSDQQLMSLEKVLALANLAISALESGATSRYSQLNALNDQQTTRLDFNLESVLTRWSESRLILPAISDLNRNNDVLPPQSQDIVDDFLDNPQRLKHIEHLTKVLKEYELVIFSAVDAVDMNQAPKSVYNQGSTQSGLKRASTVTNLTADLAQQVTDYKLHSEMLETNMKQLNQQWVAQKEALAQQLEASQTQVKTLTKQRQELNTQIQALEAEVVALGKANSLYDLKEFDSLLDENGHIDKLLMIGELSMLRKMVNATYQWRPQDPTLKPLRRIPRNTKRDCTISDALLALAKVKPQPLIFSSTPETPLPQRHSYQHKVMAEGFERYKAMMNRALQ